MLSLRTSGIEWSLGSRPHWELDDDDDEEAEDGGESELKSVADSLVVLQTLRQSREKWLTSTFPKFSSKSRGGKPAEVVPPPHTIHNRGRCDIEIGPHIFPDTIIFEVHYQYLQPSASKPSYLFQPAGHGQNSSWQATTPYGAVPYAQYGERLSEHPTVSSASATPSSTETAMSQKSPAPLLSSLGSSVSITPALISRVNVAASSNPTLANLLQLAASGKATPEQLKTLGLLIQSLAGPSSGEGSPDPSRSTSASGTPQADTSKTSTSVQGLSQSSACISAPHAQTLHPAFVFSKEFDLVLEFVENPSDRWILPCAPVVIECAPSIGPGDILMTTGIPFAKAPFPGVEKEKADATIDDNSQDLVTFRFAKASSDIWSCVSRWAGAQEKMEITRKAFERLLGKEPDRIYLAHQLPEGALSSRIQSSAMPPYSLKPIRPIHADTMKPKRVRKPAVAKLGTGRTVTMKLDTPVLATGPPPPKKKRQTKEVPPLPKIACVACGQTDVPLVMGGRYCRSCIGPEPQTYPGAPLNGGTFMHKFWAGPSPGHFTPQPIINLQPAIDPPTQPADSQQLPAASTAPKRKKTSTKAKPTSNLPSHPTQAQSQPSSSRKKG